MRLEKTHWPRCLLWLASYAFWCQWCLPLGCRLLSGCRRSKPFELVDDGDLLLLIDCMLQQRGLDTVCTSKVKGHADDGMVQHGQVRREDKLGNDAADEAEFFRWYPVILDLHRLFIAISRAVVNHDGLGGTAPDPLVWSAGALRKRRRLVHAVRDRAFFPDGFRFQQLPSVLRIWLFGLIPLVFWLSGFLS